MPRLAIHLLGSLRVTLDGAPVSGFISDKARALLAYLAVEAEQPHRRQSLAGLLWPDYPEPSARASLRSALVNVRRVIGDRAARPHLLCVDRQTLQLNPEADAWVDVTAFIQLLTTQPTNKPAHRANQQTNQPSIQHLHTAIDLYQGPFMDGFSLADSPAFEEWALLTREQLQRQVLTALGRLVDHYEHSGDIERGLPYAWRAVELDPWRESAQRGVMRLLALSGQQAAALAHYETLRAVLVDELGVEPATETTALYEQIRAGKEEVPGRALPPLQGQLAGRTALPHNLPAPTTPLIGRETELNDLDGLLADPDVRLINIFGSGGIGKTRLVLEAAAAQLDRHADGVFLVPLAPLQATEEIVPAVARALGFNFYQEEGGMGQERRRPKEQLLSYLRRKQLLLLLDNFEHLLEPPPLSPPLGGKEGGATSLVVEILQTAPGVQILVTSRARLNLQGEHLFQLAGMRYPEPESAAVLAQLAEDDAAYSAVQLFRAAARRAQTDFELMADNVAGVVRVCRLVDGMPLGLLLAAAWTGLLTPGEIADEIEGSLDFLTTELRDVPERQRSLRATFDHSWRLLTGRERELLAGLSVFRGGFTRAAAGAVTGATLRELMSLANKSLLERDAAGRYRLHELIRQYAAQRLREQPGLDETTHERHCAFFVAAMREGGEALKGAGQQVALAELDLEIENARAAWDWAAARGEIGRLDQALEGLCMFYSVRRRPAEGKTACRLAAERLRNMARGIELRTFARMLAWQANFGRWLEPVENAELVRQLLTQSMELLERPELAEHDTRRERAFVLLEMGHTASRTDFGAARRWYEQSLALYRALGEPWWTADTLYWLGQMAAMSGSYDKASDLYLESLELWRALGDRRNMAMTLWALGIITMHADLAQGERFARESITICRESGDQAGLAAALWCVGNCLMVSGNFADAHTLLEESVAIGNDLGLDVDAAWWGVVLAGANLHLGRRDRARQLAESAVALFREKKLMFYMGYALSVLGWTALADAAPAEATEILEESVSLFRQLKAPERMSRDLATLGLAVLQLGDSARAQGYLAEALQIAQELQFPLTIRWVLAPLAVLLTALGQPERAVELYALASHHPNFENSRFYEGVIGQHITTASADLPQDVVAAAQERGRARDLEETVAELLAEFEAAR